MFIKLSKADQSDSFLLEDSKRFEGCQVRTSQHKTDMERLEYSTAG